MAVTLLLALAVPLVLPARFSVGPSWAVPVAEALLLAAIVAIDRGRIDRRSAAARVLSLVLVAVLPAARIFPVVCGGQFPINPLTMQYITEELQAQGLIPDGPIEPLPLMDLEELEGCAALRERRGLTLPQLLQAWRASPYTAAAFRNYLAYEYGGGELCRPGGVGNALADSMLAIQRRLGVEDPIDLRQARAG